MEPKPGRTLVVNDQFAYAHDAGQTWAAVEGLRVDDVDVVVAEATELFARSGAERCSWWLTDRSTPDDLEEQLLGRGLICDESDYRHDGMVLTREPPAVDGVEVRRVTTLEEHRLARQVSRDAFGLPDATPEQIETEWNSGIEPAWIAYLDGEAVSVGRAIYTRVGGYLIGGATLEQARGRGAYRALVRARWDEAVRRGTPALAVGAGPMSRPILERLGFETVLELRRLESVLS